MKESDLEQILKQPPTWIALQFGVLARDTFAKRENWAQKKPPFCIIYLFIFMPQKSPWFPGVFVKWLIALNVCFHLAESRLNGSNVGRKVERFGQLGVPLLVVRYILLVVVSQVYSDTLINQTWRKVTSDVLQVSQYLSIHPSIRGQGLTSVGVKYEKPII